MGNFLVRYASRVVIYDRRAVIRLATGLRSKLTDNWSKDFISLKSIING